MCIRDRCVIGVINTVLLPHIAFVYCCTTKPTNLTKLFTFKVTYFVCCCHKFEITYLRNQIQNPHSLVGRKPQDRTAGRCSYTHTYNNNAYK